MDEATTTGSQSPDVTSGDTSQLEQAVDNTAEVETDETQTTLESDTVDTDEDLNWLKNKGLDPEAPDFARKAAQLARKTEQEFHKSRQEAKSQLQTVASESVEADDYDPTASRLQQLEVRLAVRDFYDAHPDAKDMDAELATVVKARPYLRDDLEAAYAIAKADKYEASLKEAETKGRTAARDAIARASSATMPRGNASDNAPAPKLTRDAIAGMSLEEYASRKDEIYAAINSGKL